MKRFGKLMLLMQVLTACATSPWQGGEGGSSVVATTSSVIRADTYKNISPLPDVTASVFRQQFSDGHYEDRPGYLEYDFNRDGRVDMLGVLGPEGETSMWVYDFDFDGKVDAYEKSSTDQKKSQSPK